MTYNQVAFVFFLVGFACGMGACMYMIHKGLNK